MELILILPSFKDLTHFWQMRNMHVAIIKTGNTRHVIPCHKIWQSSIDHCFGTGVKCWFEVELYFPHQAMLFGCRFGASKLTHWDWDKMKNIFKRTFFNENVWISIKISLKFVPKGPINNIPALVQIMAWGCSGGKLLSKPMMVGVPTHICVTWPQWVNQLLLYGIRPTMGSDNGMSPGQCKVIIWTNAWILLIVPLGTSFNEILIKTHTFSFKRIYLKMSSGK